MEIPPPRGPLSAAKAALVEIEADEYGGGRVERMHSQLFRTDAGSSIAWPISSTCASCI
jgi:hypothetical protein